MLARGAAVVHRAGGPKCGKTSPVILLGPEFLRSLLNFYGACSISTEPAQFLRSLLNFYGACSISTEPARFLRSLLDFYGACSISTEPAQFLRSLLNFWLFVESRAT